MELVNVHISRTHPTLFPAADYNQSLNSPGALRRRLLKYVIPVIAFSVAFNVPKFFEAKIVVRRARDS